MATIEQIQETLNKLAHYKQMQVSVDRDIEATKKELMQLFGVGVDITTTTATAEPTTKAVKKRYDKPRYTASDERKKIEQLIHYVASHPGRSKSVIIKDVRGDTSRVGKLIDKLINEGRLINHGSKSKTELHCPPKLD